MFSYPAACDLDEELLEVVTMVTVTCDGERTRKPRPYDRARCALVYSREHDTFEQLAAGFDIGTAAWRYVHHTIGHLARFAPSPPDGTSRTRGSRHAWAP
ncbi:transposase family protein [Streptomyces netropsis]